MEFLEVLETLTDIDWCWELVGETQIDHNYYLDFLHQLEKYSIRDRILVSGAVSQPELFEKYRQSDIFVLPSEFESCSMVTMEAMSFALPVISYRVGGLTELVMNTKTGYLVPLENKIKFSSGLRELLVDEKLRLHYGQQGREASLQFGTWEVAANRLNEFIKKHH
jgi:glycosyltransferase involved in cell wall biosynthesis